MRTVFLITARLKSQRLKKKILKKINSTSLIVYMVQRLKKIKELDDIIVCTSIDKTDDRLVKICKKNKIKFFRGSRLDVISRLTNAGKKFKGKYIINIPADNPLVDPIYIKKTIKELKKNKFDLVRNYSLPIGLFCYGMTLSSMKKLCNIKNNNDTEVWYRYYSHTKFFKVKTLRTPQKHRINCRLTLDYIEDFKLIKKIITYFKFKNDINIEDIIAYFKKFPKNRKINLKLNNLSIKRFDFQSRCKLKKNINYKKKVKKVYKDFTSFY